MQPTRTKQVKRGQEAREAALRGVETVYEAVSSTLGPRSANVAIARPYGRPAVVHDGVTVAKEVLPLADPFENVGAELTVEAADKTNGVGDGTTTSTVLMHAIATQAHKLITAGAKPMALRAGIEAATAAIVTKIESMSTPIKSTDDVLRIATVSAQDEGIGKMVADAYEQLGPDGIMSVEESRTTDSYLDIKTGMQFDRGYRNPYFVTDTQTGEAVVDNAFVLVTDHTIRSIEEFAPLLERLVAEEVKNIVIIANDIDGEALAFLAVNHVKGNIKALAVAAPSFGDKRMEILRDIAAVTGATFISHQAGMGLEAVTKATLGQAGRVSSSKDTTLIVDGKGAEEDITARAEQIKAQADNPDTNAYDREKLRERYAKIKSGVAVLVVGAKSEPELKERKERAIDAVSAAQAAISGGVVAGGGMTLRIASGVALKGYDKLLNDADFVAGSQLVRDACEAPFRKLLANAGYDAGEKWASVVTKRTDQPGEYGIDVISGEVVDMIETGIIDPTAVVTAALENASSNAVMLATTNVIIVEEQPKPVKG